MTKETVHAPEQTLEYWKNRAEVAEASLTFANAQIEDYNLTLEVANEQWVRSLNEVRSLEVQLRKLKKG